MTTFGYLLPAFEPDAPLLELGARAEALGFEAVWVPDSPFQYGVPDPLVMLAALAARTSTVTLATGVCSPRFGRRRFSPSSSPRSTR
jgi:alkanesulfonate monooxygenase SsuD/methylene tetrahydromethanopterin reductase-like flavin-dependent oxidoreductase (luciferase family)